MQTRIRPIRLIFSLFCSVVFNHNMLGLIEIGAWWLTDLFDLLYIVIKWLSKCNVQIAQATH